MNFPVRKLRLRNYVEAFGSCRAFLGSLLGNNIDIDFVVTVDFVAVVVACSPR